MGFFKNIGSAVNKAMENMYGVQQQSDLNNMKTLLLKPQNVDIADYSRYIGNRTFDSIKNKKSNNKILYENPFILPSFMMRSMNTYRYVYKVPTVIHTNDINNSNNDKEVKLKKEYRAFSTVPSMFNPLFGVQVIGITDNVPLLNDSIGIENSDTTDGTPSYRMKNIDKNITNCTIKELVKLSSQKDSILGQARYRYADFMYCKDLGKLANNHLITLRKFSRPIGDNISVTTTGDGNSPFETDGDVGRLVTWFGTEDNKLENILKYTVKASWKQLNAEIQELPSKEDDKNRGIFGTIANTLSATNTAGSVYGMGSNNTLWNKLAAHVINKSRLLNTFGVHYNEDANTENSDMMRNYDQHKIYTPKNTVQDTYIYEGKLTMNQEITLKFCYKLRGYENINPKSAFLDLLGNILEVTYRRGKFWGGSRKIIGPQKNYPAWKKFETLKQKGVNATQDILVDLLNGQLNIPSLISKGIDSLKNLASNFSDALKSAKNFISSPSFNNMLSAIAGNTLGRPSMYAFNSLLSGDDVGLWHLTVGNPKNPIVSIGNLILDEATIEQGGPLGLDDFPSELTVTVKLKPGRSRDSTEISRMYTKGVGSIYMSNVNVPAGYYYGYTEPSTKTQNETTQSKNINNTKTDPFKYGKDLLANANIEPLNINGINDNDVGESYNNFSIDTNNMLYALTNQSRIKAIQENIDEIA